MIFYFNTLNKHFEIALKLANAFASRFNIGVVLSCYTTTINNHILLFPAQFFFIHFYALLLTTSTFCKVKPRDEHHKKH
jgi:hypothetical protein